MERGRGCPRLSRGSVGKNAAGGAVVRAGWPHVWKQLAKSWQFRRSAITLSIDCELAARCVPPFSGGRDRGAEQSCGRDHQAARQRWIRVAAGDSVFCSAKHSHPVDGARATQHQHKRLIGQDVEASIMGLRHIGSIGIGSVDPTTSKPAERHMQRKKKLHRARKARQQKYRPLLEDLEPRMLLAGVWTQLQTTNKNFGPGVQGTQATMLLSDGNVMMASDT